MEYQYILLAIVAGLIIIFFIYIKRGTKGNKATQLKIQKEVSILEQLTKNNDTVSLKSALIEIDKLLDHAMKARRIKGETMGERLKNANKLFDKNLYNQIWEAHKLRNKLVHEMGAIANGNEIKNAYNTIKRAIAKINH